jgi:lipopolysaccharide export system permease protein
VWELLKTFSISLTVMTVMMVMVFLVQEGLRENLTPGTILELVPYTIPTALSFAIPGTILFASCIVYGRMSAANEIVAIKAMGISPAVVIWPGLFVAILLSLLTVYMNDISVAWGRRGIYRVVLQSSAKTIYSVLNAQGSFNRGNMSIVVDDVQGENLINPHIERSSDNPEDRLRIHAEMARIKVDPTENKLVFQIQNGRIEYGDQVTVSIAHKDIWVPLGDVTKKRGADGSSPSNLPLSMIQQEMQIQEQVIQNMRRQLSMVAATQMLGGNMLGLADPTWQLDILKLDNEIARKHRLMTEPWRRWANGFSCVCFVMVGAAVAIRFQRFDFWSIFAVCFAPILLAYYPLLMIGVDQAKAGVLPPYCVWIGNAALFLAGVWLIRRIERN